MQEVTVDHISFRHIVSKLETVGKALDNKVSISFNETAYGGSLCGFVLSLALKKGHLRINLTDGSGSIDYLNTYLHFVRKIEFSYIGNTRTNFNEALRMALMCDESFNPYNFTALDEKIEGYNKMTLISKEGKLAQAFQLPENHLILRGAEEQDLQLPFSCSEGRCGACVGRVISGEIEQSEQEFLSEYQMMAGYVLLCCAKAKTECVIETHQEQRIKTAA
jgi:ferredoxin